MHAEALTRGNLSLCPVLPFRGDDDDDAEEMVVVEVVAKNAQGFARGLNEKSDDGDRGQI